MTAPATPMRLDQLLVALNRFETRSRARDAIARGAVTVNGKTVTKPGAMVSPDAVIAIDDPAEHYVSRAALKLSAALDHFALSPEGAHALDIGASTGGFTQVLLERGARHVTAIDVGHGQMASRIADDPRVTNIEGLNARNLSREDIAGGPVHWVVSDVSFISLRLALPPALELADPGAICVLLVKPQFEAGKDNIGKKGLLKDPALGPVIAARLEQWLTGEMGWRSLGIAPSPIEGGDGNREFLLAGRKPGIKEE
ncbi:TlyA family RNA methyltransferase [Martelella mediterranea]|uniref:16S/23S rRNA (Cytidine-2'-O)-methyltransferase TlyA n=1 Tax=Martelella mediterranea DSM 17316 TaxID=1122214 RepID=A0A1U9Z5V8_9HYPH|nr:TlyA family RNA methyltransferase [Martelella mediterranea]AQZ53103.1 16S/23S rRNA (cytidine-2'-O)-methyltransferase TlyA [Martelella mediterranea DSM 17316]